MAGAADGGLIDLHNHSTASDGTFEPAELVAHAISRGLSAIAITDHDTIGGVKAGVAAGREKGLEVVCGTEIGIAHEPERHLVEVDILGYLIDPDNPELKHALDSLQEAKNAKLRRQVEVLKENGYPIAESEVIREACGDTVRRPHIWRVLSRHHPELRAEDFFNRTSFGGDWHVPKSYSLTLEDSIALIERAGGVPVMAHPGCYNERFAKDGTLIDPDVDAAVRTCAAAGVKGLEVIYPYDKGRPYHNDEPIITKQQLREIWDHFRTLADELGLVATGGTDFHGANKPQIEMGEVRVPYSVLMRLKELAGR
ncbi:MAG: PHP domain-containing protein [Candidatus Eisenbacteria bacterium]|nr:PHP domain-containing protein [Candidatus Eisenbacteria bacterium]